MSILEPADAVAIIPARGGSKRIERKNIKPFAGKPIIAYSIEAARKSGLFSRILISTDDPEIASIGAIYGAEAPFWRPDILADDQTPTAPVLIHALTWLAERHHHPRYFCCIYATAPFLDPDDIQAGFQRLQETDALSVFSVTTFAFPIFRALQIEKDGRVSMIWPEHALTRSQDLPEAYHDAGQFYWGHTERFLAEQTLLSSDSYPLTIPRSRVVDIDTPEDWEIAERLFKALKPSST